MCDIKSAAHFRYSVHVDVKCRDSPRPNEQTILDLVS